MSLGARSRRKGHAYERELARRFGDEAGCPAVRNLEEVRSGNSGDLVFTHGDPLCVQAKVGGRPSVWNAVKEAEEAAGPGIHPVAIVKRNGSGSRPAVELACMPLDDFLELVGLLKGGEVW